MNTISLFFKRFITWIKKISGKMAPKEKKLKDRIIKLIEDVRTNETAIIKETDSQKSEYKVISYSKTELGGDSIHILSGSSGEFGDLEKTLIVSSIANRKAVWNLLTKVIN